MTDQESFLGAIVADPGNDVPRLAYADFLQENGDEARAEFIQLQCQEARLHDECAQQAAARGTSHPAYTAALTEWGALRARATALLNAHETAWRRGPTCVPCRGTGNADGVMTWLSKGTCPACRGHADLGGLESRLGPRLIHNNVKVEFHRGFLYAVEVPELATCVTPRGAYPEEQRVPTRPTAWLRVVLGAGPERALIVGVRPADRAPRVFGGGVWWSRAPSDSVRAGWDRGPWFLPPGVFAALDGFVDEDWAQGQWGDRHYATAGAATAALGRALVTIGRRRET